MLSNGFCVAGAGTAWSGIGAALQKYGFSVKNHDTMPAFFAEMKKGGRCGILLMTKGTRGGVTWTTGGHFLACSGHKVSNGKNYLYMHDPGGRKHDGWYCYETTMKGLVRQVWSCYIKDAKTSTNTSTTAAKTSKFKGFDISNWQGKISVERFKKAKAAGYTFTIIRCGFAANDPLNKDAAFEINYKNAIKAGMKVGMYYYSKARTVAAARREANYCLQLINGRALHYPIYIDFEDKVQANLGKTLSASICNAFCEKVKAAGYTPMVYANYTMLNNYMDYKSLQKKYRIWLANYTTKGTATTYPGEYWMWQYSSSGKVNGLSGCIDMNYIFDNGQGGSSTNTSTTSPADETDYDEAWETANETNESGDFVVKSVTPYKAMAADDLNYRTGPGTNYSIVGTFNKGKILNVVGVSGKWFKLRNGYFVKSSYTLKIQKARTSFSARMLFRDNMA